MITSLTDLPEAVAFETYALNRMLPVTNRNQSDAIDLRGTTTIHSTHLVDSVSSGAVDKITNDLAPLLFGAAWKILDLIIEFALNDANIPADRRNGTEWTIAGKKKQAMQAGGSSHLLTQDQSVWEAVTALYANTVEHRHCLVHRTASIDPASGSLSGKDKNGQTLRDLTLDEQKASARIALLTAEGIASGGISARNEDHLRYWLDQVLAHTNKSAIGAGKKGAPVDIFTTLKVENGQYFVDIEEARTKASRSFAATTHFNVIFDIPGDSGRQLYAELENVPQEKTMVELVNLPSWLSNI